MIMHRGGGVGGGGGGVCVRRYVCAIFLSSAHFAGMLLYLCWVCAQCDFLLMC